MKATSTSYASKIARGFNPQIHGARGLFAGLIVLFHVVNSRLPTFAPLSRGWAWAASRSTEHGVELFFGISGIVIVGALSRARGPGVFAVERATRIFPILWASIAVLVLLSGLTGYENRHLPSLGLLLANLLALPPLVPMDLIHPAAWSLSYEMAFYMLCAIGWALRRRIGAWSYAIILPLALLALAYHLRAALMPVGMLVAVTMRDRPQAARLIRTPGLYLLAFLALWEVLCQHNGQDLMAVNLLTLKGSGDLVLMLVACVCAGLAFLGLMGGRGISSTLLRLAPMQFLGTVSYSLYIWHPIVMAVVKHAMYVTHVVERAGPASQLLFLVLTAPPSLLVAWASQMTLEKHVTRWLRGLLERGRATSPVVEPPITAAPPELGG